ncbi:MAG: AhpC/TSA family protein [Rhizobiales bacterium]|nr:AhpC/TSA family protein [Hyphomicrobiales bacterium]
MHFSPPIPRRPTPSLSFPLAGGGRWSIEDERPENFTLILFYRGLHCPICKRQLTDLESKLSKFAELGVTVVAVSTDTKERAETAKSEWGLSRLRVGYGVSLDTARSWGLYVSAGKGKTSTGVDEPPFFAEPGMFLVKPDGTLYFASIQTMPFARPQLSEVLGAIEFVLKSKYPARGEVEDLPQAAE